MLLLHGVQPMCNNKVLQPLQVVIFLGGLLDLLYGHTFWYIDHHLYCIYPNLQTIDCLIFILIMVVLGQPICNKNFWPLFVYYTYPVMMEMMDSQDDMLHYLGQCHYIFFEYGQQGFMINYYGYLPGKAIMMKFFQTM